MIGYAIDALRRDCRNTKKTDRFDRSNRLLRIETCSYETWVSVFPRPGQTAPSQKWTYVKKVTLDVIDPSRSFGLGDLNHCVMKQLAVGILLTTDVCSFALREGGVK